MDANTIKQTIQAVVEGLTPVAQKLQIPLEGLFKWGIKHNYALAVADIFPCVLLALFGWKFVKLMKLGLSRSECTSKEYCYHRGQTHFACEEGLVWAAAALGVVVAVLLIITLCATPTGIERVLAPEWCTLRDLHALVTGQ